MKGDFGHANIVYQLPDGITFGVDGGCSENCDCSKVNISDLCFDDTLFIDINGPTKGKNKESVDIFRFMMSDSLGVLPVKNYDNVEDETRECMISKEAVPCTWWVIEFGNLDYLKADEHGNCNDSNIVLDGVTNTSCH